MTFCSCDSLGTSVESHDPNGITNVTTAFHKSGQLKLGAIQLFGSVMSLVPVSKSYDDDSVINSTPQHFLGQDDQNEGQHDFFGHVTPLVSALESSIASFCSLGQGNQNEVQYNFWGHVMPLAPAFASHGTTAFPGSR